jgi:hypothetical protein
MVRVGVVLYAAAFVSGSWGCFGDDSPPIYRPSDGGSSDGPAGRCNTLVNDAPHVVPQNRPTAPPAPLGGTITDGRYVLTTYNLFIGPDGQAINLGDFWAADVVMVAGTTIQSVEGYRMEGLEHLPGTSRSYSFTASGTTLSVAETCPMPTEARSIEFTASASEYRWYVPAAGATAELTYTRQ